MIEEDFYAVIKLKTGEEVFAKVAASEEDDKIFLILSNPVVIGEVHIKSDIVGYKIEPWIKMSKDDLFFINLDDVLTMSESFDLEVIRMHQEYIHRNKRVKNGGSGQITKKMGYITNIHDAKEILEKLFNKESETDSD